MGTEVEVKKRRHTAAPNAEWVLMYRKGLTCQRIAALVGRQIDTVGYHLKLARVADPVLDSDHAAAARPTLPASSMAVIQELIEYVQKHGVFPSSAAADPAVRRLGRWMSRRRRDSRLGVLHNEYRTGLNVLPDWDGPGRKKSTEDGQWARKLDALKAYMQAGHGWPRNGTGENDEERAHGRWLGTQRHLRHTGTLLPSRVQTLDEGLPGWVHGRKGKIGNPPVTRVQAEQVTYQGSSENAWFDTSSVLARDEVLEWISQQRYEGSGEILIFGSHVLWNHLLASNAVDELHLMVSPHPLVHGVPLFNTPAQLKLIDVRTFEDSSNVQLRYTSHGE